MREVPHQLMELNSPQIWDWQWIQQCINQAKQFGYTGIILHQQELLSILSAPFSTSKHLSTQNENLIHQRNFSFQYLKKLSNLVHKNDLTFWLEGEAFPNDDLIRRKFPEYDFDNDIKGEFWVFFLRSIVDSIIDNIHYINGLVLSVTIPDFESHKVIDALNYVNEKLSVNNKKLVIRDYIDNSWPRRQLISVLSQLPRNIRASIKATELDYHPGFANHPHIAALPKNPKWIEFDLWGSGYGWSYLPCFLVDEIKERLQWALEQEGAGIEAIVTRVCWQWLPGRTTFDSVNIINMFGLTHLDDNDNTLLEKQWLDFSDIQFTSFTDQNIYLSSLYNSYQWLISTPNILGRRIHYQSQIPENLEHAFQLLHLDTRSANWTQSFQPLLPIDDVFTGMEQMNLIKLEKEKSMFIASNQLINLKAMYPSVRDPNLIFKKNMDAWEIAKIYSELFQLVSLSTINAMWKEHYPKHPMPKNILINNRKDLYELANRTNIFINKYEHPIFTSLPLLFNQERIIQFADSLLSSEV